MQMSFIEIKMHANEMSNFFNVIVLYIISIGKLDLTLENLLGADRTS